MIEHPDIKLHDGVEVITPELLGALCGIGPDEVKAEVTRQSDPFGHLHSFNIPKSWKRGAKELQARHGSNDLATLIAAVSPIDGLRS